MIICIEQWCARLVLFVASLQKENDLNNVNCKVFVLIIMLLLTHGDIESNPGPKRRTSNYFSFYDWNVNSIMAHNKRSLLPACNTVPKYDVICISETYLDKSVDNNASSIDVCNIIKADYPQNQKRSGICIYFKEQLK